MTTNPTAPSGAVKPPAPAGRHRITDYDSLIDELAYTYDGRFSRASIAQAVAEARAALEPTARIADSCQSLSPASPVNSSPLRRKRQARSPNRFQSCCCAVTPARSIPVSATWIGTCPTRTTAPSRRYAISVTISKPASPPCFETSTSN